MSWAVGERNGRHIGYGVPAKCDQTGCGADIDRGLSYACGGGVAGTVANCGRFFCGAHLAAFMDGDEDGGEWVCDRCATGQKAYDPTPDTPEWAAHVLSDESWAKWREENPDRVRVLAEIAGVA